MQSVTWFVTGCHTGFGRALALQLAQAPNVNLVATARRPQTQLKYLDRFNHGQIKKAQLDVTDHSQVKKAVQTAQQTFGRIDVLVNNAGIGYFGTFEESNWRIAHRMFDIDFWGLCDVTRTVLPLMRKQRHGTIVNFSSTSGLKGFPALAYYNSVKHAVEGVTKTIAKEVQPLGIKCLLVEPSDFRTDWGGRSSQKTNSKFPDDYRSAQQYMNDVEAHGSTQAPGDPKLAAQIIYDQVTHHWQTLPLHLPLGVNATNGAATEFEHELTEIKRMRKISVSADDR